MAKKDYVDINSLVEQNDPERKALFEVLFGNDSDREPSEAELEAIEKAVLRSVSTPGSARTVFLHDALSQFVQKTLQQAGKENQNSLDEMRQLLSGELDLELSEDGLFFETEEHSAGDDCPTLPAMEEFGARKHPPFSTKIERSSDNARAHAESSSLHVSAESACTGQRETATAALGFTITPRYDMSGDIRIRAHLLGKAHKKVTEVGNSAYETRAWIELKVVRLVGEPPIFTTPLGSGENRWYLGPADTIPSTVEVTLQPTPNLFRSDSRPRLSVLITAHVEAVAPWTDCERARDELFTWLQFCMENPEQCDRRRPEDFFRTASAEINMAVCGVDVMYEPAVNPPWDNSVVADVRRRLLELEKRLRVLPIET